MRRMFVGPALLLVMLLVAAGALLTVGLDAQTSTPTVTMRASDASRESGDSFAITLDVAGADVVAVEATVSFDRSFAEVAGAGETDPAISVLLNNDSDSLAVGAFSCTVVTCDEGVAPSSIDELTVLFNPLQDGRIRVSVSEIRVVTSGGEVHSLRDRQLAVRSGSPQLVTSPSAAWSLPNAKAVPEGLDLVDLDHTFDAVLNDSDLVETVATWHEVRRYGDPCDARGLERISRHDVNSDGCVEIVDIFAVLDALSSAEIPSSAPDIAAARAAWTPLSWPPRIGSPTFVVDSTSDDADVNLGDGVCATAAGVCSLRSAILESNAMAGPNRIEFNIPGSGPHTIQLVDRLPIISDLTGGVTIDGYTQPLAQENTHPLQFLPDIRVQIRGDGRTGFDGFYITSPENVIRGFAVYDMHQGVRLEEDNASRNHIVGNFLGTDITSTFDERKSWGNAGIGVFANAGPKLNVIGTPALGDRNLISGNSSWGIRLDQGGTDNNIVWNNIIGLNNDGTDDLPNNGGIDIQWLASFNIVGGLNVGERNVFSGSEYTGVDLSHRSTENYVVGNFIGTTLDGTQATSFTDNRFGVILKDDANSNFITDNVIVNSREDGIWNKHNYTGRNTITDNRIGVTLDGTPAGNSQWGIWLSGHDDVIENNIIAHNEDGGIYVSDYQGGGANDDEATVRNRISKNVFFENDGLGIDIEPQGPNSNDPGDSDTGTHDLLNHPELVSLSAGSLTGTACPGCQVEVYLGDPGAATQGSVYLGSVVVDAAGDFTFADPAIANGEEVTALAIDGQNNTSEFSPALVLDGTTGGGTTVGPGTDPQTLPIPPLVLGTPSGRFETLSVTATASWATVVFDGTFQNAVVACSVNYENNTTPVVVRVRNVGATGLDIRLQSPGDVDIPLDETVECLVIDEGLWQFEDGTTVEAHLVDVPSAGGAGNWVATELDLAHDFAVPVVMGQVMTENDARWSTFWSQGTQRWRAPVTNSLAVGYHVGEDTDTARAGEQLGVITFEATHSTIAGVDFEAGRTTDTIPGTSATVWGFSSPFGGNPAIGVVSQTGMDGANGGWAYTTAPETSTGISLLIDEDQIRDTERVHPTEQVAYVVFSEDIAIDFPGTPDFQPELLIYDDFERTLMDTWGQARLGGVWDALYGSSASSHFSVANGVGTVSIEPGEAYEGLLGGTFYQDIDSTIDVKLGVTPDANTEFSFQQRRIDASNFYRGRVRVVSGGFVQVQLIKADQGAFSVMSTTTVPGLQVDPNTTLRVRMVTTGDGVSDIKIKVWEVDDPEPLAWSLETTDSSAALQNPGALSMRFRLVGASNLAVVNFEVDELISIDTP